MQSTKPAVAIIIIPRFHLFFLNRYTEADALIPVKNQVFLLRGCCQEFFDGGGADSYDEGTKILLAGYYSWKISEK